MEFFIYIYNIDYTGHDFCGEISGEQARQIFDAQPKYYTLPFDTLNDYSKEHLGIDYDNFNYPSRNITNEEQLIKYMLDQWISEQDDIFPLCPTDFDFSFLHFNPSDLVDIGYVCEVANTNDMPLVWRSDDERLIDSLSELLWMLECSGGNEFDLDESTYDILIQPFLKANWPVIKSYINFVK